MDLPVETDSRGRGTEGDPRYHVVVDRLGRVICDTLNSDHRFSTEEGRRHLDALVDAMNATAAPPARATSQIDDLLTLVGTLARMTTPTDGVTDQEEVEGIMADLDDETLCSDATALYEMIRKARKIVNGEKAVTKLEVKE
jgi:ABC-type oligopeptide transport system substrate-binding subunit